MDESIGKTRVEIQDYRNPFDLYLDSRLKDKTVFRATRFTNYLQEEPSTVIQDEYKNALSSAAKELTTQLVINPDLFNDTRHCEMFFAICDSWTVNQKNLSAKNIPTEDYEHEKQFLIQVTRVLAGNHSRFNLNAYQNHEPKAEYYVDDENTEERKKERKLYNILKNAHDPNKSKQVEELFTMRGEGSLLEIPRQRLGITSVDQENKVTIIVTDDKQDQWKESVGNAPAFVTPPNENELREMYIGLGCYEEANTKQKEYDLNTIKHEWVHTQGTPAAIGVEGNLGMIIEEERADICSNAHGHIDSKYILDIMKTLIGGDRLQQEFESAIKLSENISNFYRFISNNYGVRSFLLLMTTHPPAYQQLNGIDYIPGISNQENEKTSDLLQQIYEEFIQIDPSFTKRFRDGLRTVLIPEMMALFYPSVIRLRTTRAPTGLTNIVEEIYKEKYGELPDWIKY